MGDGFFYVIVGVWAGWLMMSDLRVRRLPDPLTVVPAVAVVVCALVLDPTVVLAGLVWPALYVATGLISGGVGGGDIKLAVSLGVLTAAVAGVPGVIAAIAVAGLISAIAAWRSGSTAHGPAMLAACAVVCIAAGTPMVR